jgi:hypothetical protein
MAFEIVNKDYEDRIADAVVNAILDASRVEGENASAVLSGEVIAVCLKTIALLAATSDVTSSPTKTREFAEHCSKRLRSLIAATKDIQAAGGLDFVTIVEAAKRH